MIVFGTDFYDAPFEACFDILQGVLNLDDSWQFVGDYVLGKEPAKDQECPRYYLDGSNDNAMRKSLISWLEALKKSRLQTETPVSKSSLGADFLTVVRTVMFLAKGLKENFVDPGNVNSRVFDILEEISSKILEYTDQQRVIMARADTRLLLQQPFGSGKSLLLKDKCRKLLADGERVLFVLAYGGWEREARGGSGREEDPSFLFQRLKKEFQEFKKGELRQLIHLFLPELN